MILTTQKILKHIKFLTILPVFCLGALAVLSAYKSDSVFSSIFAFIFLGIAIMSSVHQAEEIAHNIGEGLGALLLALSVTIIEVGLIVSLMSPLNPGASVVARDTVFAAVIILCNGLVGISLLLGGMRFKNAAGFQFKGSSSMLVVIITLSVLCFILPNYTTTVEGPYYNEKQLIFVSIFSILLYIALIIFQNKTHKKYFETLDYSEAGEKAAAQEVEKEDSKESSTIKLVVDTISLIVGLATVIGLAKLLAPTLEKGVDSLGYPREVVGVIIATIVLFPEVLTAIVAANRNRLQTSLNLALGSGAASIALTIPIVSIYSIMTKQPLTLGLDAKSTVFLILTFMVSSINLGFGKANSLQGAVHLIILASYFALTVIP